MTGKRIDFLVIGAAKSGTTSLFRYLAAHPMLSIPGEKELDFFCSDEKFARGVDWYLSHWRTATEGQLLGEVSPHYMQCKHAAERIAHTFPRARLIALLRNPVERAYSHYSHVKRRHRERRSFDEAAGQWLERHRSLPATAEQTELNRLYFAGSEYGRILTMFRRYFDRDQIEVLFTEQLETNTVAVVQSVYRWLCVDESFTSECFSRLYNGGSESLGQRALQWARSQVRRARERTGIRTPIEAFVPLPFRGAYRRLRLRLETKSGRKLGGGGVDALLRQRLIEAYAADVAMLKREFGVRPPWPEFYQAEREIVQSTYQSHVGQIGLSAA
jgi:hypothetical protein